MLLIEHIESYNKQFLFLLPPVKNNLIMNSIFTRIIYSPPMISFNGLYLSIPFTENQSFIQKLHEIENDILSVYVFCIANSRDNILNEKMPSQWSRYAIIISVLCFVLMIIMNVNICIVLTNGNSKCIQQKGIIISHFLLIFVYIQYIISYYYQTDGFTI